MTKRLLLSTVLLLFSLAYSYAQSAKIYDSSGVLIDSWAGQSDGLEQAIQEVKSRNVAGDTIRISGVFTHAVSYNLGGGATYTIIGDGMGKTIIQPYADGTTEFESVFMDVGDNVNVHLRDLSIRNHVTSEDPVNQDKFYAFRPTGGGTYTFENVEFYNLKNPDYRSGGILVSNPLSMTFKNCIFDSCDGKHGGAVHIRVTSSSSISTPEVTFEGCTFKNNTASTGYYAAVHTDLNTTSKNLKINFYRNVFHNNVSGSGSCVNLKGANTEAVFVNNTFGDNRGPNIELGSGGIKDLTLVNNVFFGSYKNNGNANRDLDLSQGVSGTVVMDNNIIDYWDSSLSGGIVPNSTNDLNVAVADLEMPEELENNHFKPGATSIVIDAGKVYSPITDGFSGNAPEVGAYETTRTFAVQDYVSSDLSDWATGIRELIADVKEFSDQGGESIISFESKVYNLPLDTLHLNHIQLFNIKNLTIEGNGATLVSHPSNAHITTWECENLEINNMDLDFNPTPFTQGDVIALDSASSSFDFTIESGYDAPFVGKYIDDVGENNVTFYNDSIFDHNWIRIDSVADKGNGVYTAFADVTNGTIKNFPGILVGHRMTVKNLMDIRLDTSLIIKNELGQAIEKRNSGNIVLQGSKNVRLNNINSYSSFRQVYHFMANKDVVMDNVNIKRRPGTNNLLAGLKGGVIIREPVGELTLKNSYLEACADDLANFDTKKTVIHKIIDDNTIEVETAANIHYYQFTLGQQMDVTGPIPNHKGFVQLDGVSIATDSTLILNISNHNLVPDSTLNVGDRFFIRRLTPTLVENTRFTNSLKKGIILKGYATINNCDFEDLNYGIHSYSDHHKNEGLRNGMIPHKQLLTNNTFKNIDTGGIVCHVWADHGNFDQEYIIANNTFTQITEEGNGITLKRINGAKVYGNTFSFESWIDSSYVAVYEEGNVNTSIYNNTGDRLGDYTGDRDITYFDEGTNSNATTYTIGNSYTFSTPTKTGYTFDGWYTGALFANKVETLADLDPTSELHLYAKWTPDSGARFANMNIIEEKPYLIHKAGIQITGAEKIISNVVIMDMLGKVLLNKVTDKSFIPYSFDNDKLYIIRMNGETNKVIFR